MVACCPCGRPVSLIDYLAAFHTSDHPCVRELCLMNANIGTTGCALLNVRAPITNFLALASRSSLDDPMSVYLNDGILCAFARVDSDSILCSLIKLGN